MAGVSESEARAKRTPTVVQGCGRANASLVCEADRAHEVGLSVDELDTGGAPPLYQ